METVKVDIQKLQLLNDRIAQTIEALNQVRMSVQAPQQTYGTPYGYGHSFGFGPQAFGQTFGQPFQPSFQPGYGTPFTPYVMTPNGPQYTGIQHTSPTWAQTPAWAQQTPVTASWTQQTPWTQTPWTTNGISHSTWDPQWQLRTAQTHAWMPYTTW